MTLNWLDAQDASKIGAAMADDFATDNSTDLNVALQMLLKRADREVRTLKLNFYKKAKFANAFRWRLLERGMEKELAIDVTQKLVVHLSANKLSQESNEVAESSNANQLLLKSPKALFAEGNKCLSRSEYDEAINIYTNLLSIQPRHAGALNNLGAALCGLGRYQEAEGLFRQAIEAEPRYVDPYSNLGNALSVQGAYHEAETYLRRAIKLNPRFLDARTNLGLTLANLSQIRDAKSQFSKVLKIEPRNAEALFGLAFVAKVAGDLDKASELAEQSLTVKPSMAKALATLMSLRKMSSSDSALLAKAEKMAASSVTPLDESELRFAIGKHYDDVGDFDRAFQNYKRANDLLKPTVKNYSPKDRKNFVDNMIRVYTKQTVAQGLPIASDSQKPVFVVGMPRSGTSLVEQIIASHPSARGAGELEFWNRFVHENRDAVTHGTFGEWTANRLVEPYLAALDGISKDALRIVDKLPRNSDYLGVIHSVFPKARIIHMQRNPIDTCLSCYFQKFLPLSFTLELADLSDYYRQHHRLMTHWRAVLPSDSLLDVCYEELVADQETWSRKILDFIGLDWDGQVLNFHKTKRPVATASFWQVRQELYDSSVGRWRNYKKYLGPLANLKN